ncbi:hypothetical protein QKW60_01385 [Defluviimonas aestuarii]|uniref:hypothetical protein n=1 Tax=Albidovulum aestuarii TaxID=1130726 RepID=UPI00249B6ABF|nr:hypothetical protein [Defluviimonas aestuarii]MDI3335051.1 hypothetical protein [Defluviimonas aestuarii]
MSENKQQIIAPGDSGHSVDLQSLPTESLRGIINKLNEKSQSATRLFRDNYQISVDDIRQLIEKITQEFHSCTVIAQSATVSLFLSQNERHDFRTWNDFESFDTSQSGRTNSIQVEVTHDVIRNKGETPERYVVQVSIQNMPGSRGFVLGPISIGPMGEFPTPPSPIAMTVSYNNYILGKNLISTVEQWERALERREHKWITGLQRRSSLIAEVAFVVGIVSGVLAAANITSIYTILDISRLSTEQWIIRAALCVVVFSYIGKVTGEFTERHIDKYSLPNNITLTKGDRNHQSKLAKSNTRTLVKSAVGFALVIFEIVVGTWAAEIVPSVHSFF